MFCQRKLELLDHCAALRLAPLRAWALQLSEQNTCSGELEDRARAAGIQVPHTLQQTNRPWAGVFRVTELKDPAELDRRTCCMALRMPRAVRR
jgi:hypothetical protein